MAEFYTIDNARLTAIAQAVALPEYICREYLLADWTEGAEHQEWLDSASLGEIVAWLHVLHAEIMAVMESLSTITESLCSGDVAATAAEVAAAKN